MSDRLQHSPALLELAAAIDKAAEKDWALFVEESRLSGGLHDRTIFIQGYRIGYAEGMRTGGIAVAEMRK